ncbi:LLM class flavin-dependent oxidoreductase [Amycolatopsis nigrescens]|uniref:LLM class flavin-dependent oxidoreductase n=1 Tax=Amycolatopsis nigrescens TaxID=381445 RepID=UPI000374CF3A|nr:LLM class flavin-dependent oxidoreductase [Amycolatopsis nigrescens]
MVPERPQLHLGAALDGAGAHPAAWRVSDAEPRALFTAAHYLANARLAESAALDFVTLDDSLAPQPGGENVVRGRLDALLTLSAIAPLTHRIGLLPTVTTTHTEPFHVSTAVATLDYASGGRAGLLAVPSVTEAENGHFGRRALPTAEEAFRETSDFTDVVARLWDSWQDDAIIRDVEGGRFIDRDRLHYVDFEGEFFRVKGPSITPRPPQGRPVIATHGESPHADVVLAGAGDLAVIGRVRGARVLAELSFLLANTEKAALERKERLDELHGEAFALEFVGTPAGLAERLVEGAGTAGLDGFLLRPAVLPDDLRLVAEQVVPALRAAGAFRHEYTGTTLRDHLGFERPANRYPAGV